MRRPTRTTPKGAQARARVIKEATRVFARAGYRAGSMSKIADAAGLTQQGLLHYFPNKSALLLAVVAERERATAAFLEDDSGSGSRSEEHTSELQSRGHLVCRLLLEKKNNLDILLSTGCRY